MDIIKTGVIKFVDLIRLRGDIETFEAIFNISKSGIAVSAKTENNYVGIKAILKGEFEDIGEIGISDLSLFKNLLSTFESENLTLTKNKNRLEITSKDEKIDVKANLTNPEFIKFNVPVAFEVPDVVATVDSNVIPPLEIPVKAEPSPVNVVAATTPETTTPVDEKVAIVPASFCISKFPEVPSAVD